MSFFSKMFGKGERGESSSTSKAFKEQIESVAKTAWIPRVADGDGGALDSKFSGAAYIPSGEEWPKCGNCENPMQLFVQVNAAALPQEAKELVSEGILQLFYCTNDDPMCEIDCEAYFPFSKASLVRLVNPEGGSAGDSTLVQGSFPPKKIVGWDRVDDYADWQDLETMGIKSDSQASEGLLEELRPKPGEKFGGWPHWVQGIEYPNCPKCGEPMRLLFQVDSEQNLPYMFGDVGCGHITQCESHPDQLMFGWACS